jgi:hypothetical protein
MQVGNWDVEINEGIPPASVRSGSCYISSAQPLACQAATLQPQRSRPVTISRRYDMPSNGIDRYTPVPKRTMPEGCLLLEKACEATGSRDIYVDAFLVRKLRPHQQDGVKFLCAVRIFNLNAC